MQIASQESNTLKRFVNISSNGNNRTGMGGQGVTDSDEASYKAYKNCVSNVLSKPLPSDGRLYCNATWDSWGCWNYTLAGTTAHIPCPEIIEGFDPNLKASKICTINGTWWIQPDSGRTWSNYTTCIDLLSIRDDQMVITVFIAGYSISMAAIIISLFIFFLFKQLSCDRITLHKNLFISYILNGLIWILYYTIVASNAHVLTTNPLWCKVMHVITSYFTVCNFFWMFNEGFYLHTIIVLAFTSGKRLLIACYIIGWVIPLLIVTIYTSVRGVMNGEATIRCWISDSSLHWINAGPICASLILNLIFLCNIVRVLVTKLRAVNSPDTNQTKKAVRAIIILIPLLGLQYMIIPFRPTEPAAQTIYLIIAAVVVSFQGLFVAVIFCFCNGEVIAIVKRKWGQHQLMQGKTRSRGMSFATQVTTANMDYSYTATSHQDEPSIKPCLNGKKNGKPKIHVSPC
ncbi:calcitonin gene-related peptide type 1 receptor-like [Tubulanus polymorphus]|uniref:calcitonin gene-related peptide type 1 receptor-like n=1 Tax=Tubulanus polymorphus TaxID=672921 RepID=UPI003DA65347